MAMIDGAVIEQIRASSNIVDIINEYTSLKRQGSTYKGLCPFHNEKTPSFTVDDKKQLFHCFGCGVGGDVVSFIMQIEGLTYPESLHYLGEKAGINIEYSNTGYDNQKNKKLYDINKDIMMYFYRNLLTNKEAINYLKSRGLSSRIVNTFMLGFANNSWDDLLKYVESKNYDLKDIEELGLISLSKKNTYYDKYRNRIIFPIINHYGNVIGFGGRSIDGSNPKYLNSPESSIFKKRYNLYGLNIYKKQKKRDIILVEGYMDVIALNNHGIDYAVASLGTAFTNDQAKLLNRYADNIFICYDSDEAGLKATDKAIDIFLQVGIKPKIISLPQGLDPDDFIKENSKETFLSKMDTALDVYNYRYNKILDIYTKANENEKYDKLDLFVEFLSSIDSDLTREIFINNVGTLFNISKDTLISAINKYNNDISVKNNYKETKTKAYERKVLVDDKSPINPNELEILRLIFNQPDDYQANKDFFDNALQDDKIQNVRDFILYKQTEKFDQNDTDYTYILNYIRDDTNPIIVEELMEKVERLEKLRKLNKLNKLKSLKNKS